MTRYKIVLSISHFASVRFKLQPFLNFTLLRSVDSQLFTLETNNESRRLFRIKSRIGYSRILRGCKRWWHELYTYSTVYFHLLLRTFECLRSPPDTISNITSSKSSLMTHQLNENRQYYTEYHRTPIWSGFLKWDAGSPCTWRGAPPRQSNRE